MNFNAQSASRPKPTRRSDPPISYRAVQPVMVLAFRDNHHAAITIPVGEVFQVVEPSSDDRFVVVRVKNEELLVFEIDLRDRCRLVASK